MSAVAQSAVSFSKTKLTYTITRTSSGYTVTDKQTGALTAVPAGTSQIFFSDSAVLFDASGVEGQAYRLYQAAFDRKPDMGGLGFQINAVGQVGLAAVAGNFIASPEFQSKYGNVDDTQFITLLYQNVLHRAPDAGGLQFHLDELASGQTRADVLTHFSESPENQANVIAAINAGVTYFPVGASGFTQADEPIRDASRPEDDTFAVASTDSCRWFDWNQSGGASSQGSGGLRLSTSAAAGTFSAARRVSQYMIKGDVDLQVKVQAIAGFDAIADSAQLYASFGLMASDNNRFIIELAKAGSQNVIHAVRVTSTDGRPNFENFDSIAIPTSNVRLRILQSGATATLQYDAGSGWATAATVPAFSSDAYVEMTATAVGVARDFTAAFTDFEIVSGSTSWHSYVRGDTFRRTDFMAGGTGGDSLNAKFWGSGWATATPFTGMKSAGMGWFASDLRFASSSLLASTPVAQWRSLGWHDEFWRSRELVAESLKEAQAAGLRLYVQLLLSDDAAYFGRQSAPAAWKGLSVADMAAKVRAESAATVNYLKSQGVNVEVYSIGNEIDTGILDFLPGNRIPTLPGVSSVDVDYLRSAVWPTEATLLAAAIDGVKSAAPGAKIVLHVTGLLTTAPSYIGAKSFFKFMKEQGVQFDIAGISHPYPQVDWGASRYTADCWMQHIQELSDYNAGLGKKTLIAEASHPRMPGSYIAPIPDFPYTDAGQDAFVREHLRHGNNNPNMAGFLYFYADYYLGMSADASVVDTLEKPGLFYPDLGATPALLEFGFGDLRSP